MCMSCQKARSMGSKISPTRQAYSPKRTTTTKTFARTTQFGSPKVRMSFGSKKR